MWWSYPPLPDTSLQCLIYDLRYSFLCYVGVCHGYFKRSLLSVVTHLSSIIHASMISFFMLPSKKETISSMHPPQSLSSKLLQLTRQYHPCSAPSLTSGLRKITDPLCLPRSDRRIDALHGRLSCSLLNLLLLLLLMMMIMLLLSLTPLLSALIIAVRIQSLRSLPTLLPHSCFITDSTAHRNVSV